MKKPIIIQGAMDQEINYLIKNLNCKKKLISNFEFYEGFLNEYPIVISKTKVGEINSAIATTIGIINYKPIIIINIGTCGSYRLNINVNDIIIGTSFYYLSDYSMKKMNDIYNPWTDNGYLEENNKKIEYNINKKLEKYLKKQFMQDNVYFGVICSGDVWTRNKKNIVENNKKYNGLCEAMEVSGAYMAAKSLNCLIFACRVVSNNELKDEIFDISSTKYNQKFILKILPTIINDISILEKYII